MTFGVTVNGDENRLLFSTDTSNLTYQGKASIYTIYNSQTYDYPSTYDTGQTIYGMPGAVFYEYRITLNSSITSIMPFIYNSVNKRVSIISNRKLDSSTWEILTIACTNPNTTGVISSSTYIPEVYVFASYMNTAVNTGNGINVFDASGNPVFTTNSKPLLIKAVYNGSVPYSNIKRIPGQWNYIDVNGALFSKTITEISPTITPVSISKPAILFSSNQSVAYNAAGIASVWELSAVYSSSTKNLGLEWTNVGSIYSGPSTQQSSAANFFSLIIDGAQYD